MNLYVSTLTVAKHATVVLFASMCFAAATQAQTIRTIAGNGTTGYGGDGGPATSAMLVNPYDVVVDGAGNRYIADTFNYRIRKVTPDGVISTVAGNGISGFSGDGGPAINASLGVIFQIAVDASGNLYLGDHTNYRVRKVTPAGVISTVAGNGVFGFSGDGGPATSAALASAMGLAFDQSGNLYISDPNNRRIRKVAPGGVISTVAGSGSYGFSGDGGPATSASLAGPRGLKVGSNGNLYFSDHDNHRIRMVTPAGVISTVAGNGIGAFSGDGGPATSASLWFPYDVTADGVGNLFIADSSNVRVRKVSSNGVITTFAGNGSVTFSGDGVLAVDTGLHVVGVDADPSGDLYIANYGHFRVQKIQADVLTPEAAITDLADYLNGQSTITAGIRNALLVKLNAALAALDVPNLPLACQAMQDFINQARALRGRKHITAAQADYMIVQASDIRLLMGCP